MRKRDQVIGIVVFAIAVLWIGYYNWCSTEHKRTLGTSQEVKAAVRPLSVEKDCADVLKVIPNLQIKPKTLTIVISDLTSSPNEKHLEDLAGPACRSLYGARQVAIAAHEGTSWFNGLPFVLVDDIDGATDQAQYQRKLMFPWETGVPRLVLVARGLFAKSSTNELIWTIGHELGHGVYTHSGKRKWLLLVSFVIIMFGAVLGWRHNAGRIQKVIGTLIVISGFVFYPISIALFSKFHEMDADIFGVKAAAGAGIGNKEAQAAALNMLNRHKMDEDSWWKCGVPNQNVHPSTKERVDRIGALQQFD